LVTLKLAGNELLSFPNDRIDVLASLLHLDVSRNHIDHLPVDLPYLYRVKQVIVASFFKFYFRHNSALEKISGILVSHLQGDFLTDFTDFTSIVTLRCPR